MLMLMKILLVHCVTWIHSQKHIAIPPDKQHQLDIEPLIVNIRIRDVDGCRKTTSGDCQILIKELLQCEQIILNDLSLHSSQDDENLARHEKILEKYQSSCDDTSSDYLIDELFDLK